MPLTLTDPPIETDAEYKECLNALSVLRLVMASIAGAEKAGYRFLSYDDVRGNIAPTLDELHLRCREWEVAKDYDPLTGAMAQGAAA